MNSQETVKLLRLVKAACPAQKLDEYTPDVWQPILAETRYEDAQQAIIDLARIQAFIAPSEIITHVTRVINDRIARAGELTPPPGLSQMSERIWLKDTRKRIAAGVPKPQAITRSNHDLGIAIES